MTFALKEITMDNKKNKENVNQSVMPVFWDENDGKWHFTEKCLNQESQIAYVTNPRTFETPDEAMQAYLEASQKFSEMMNQMKMQEAKIPTFSEELKTWYHNAFLLTASNSYSICMGYVLYNFLLPNLGKIGEKPLNKVTWMDIDKLIAMTSDICCTSQAQTYKFFRIFYNDMRLTERILENPMENVTPRKFQQPVKNFVVYTEDEVKKLLRASWKTIHFLEICLMLHGLRYGEIRGLRFTDFNKRERTVTVRRQAVRLSDVDYAAKKMRISRTGIEIKATKTEESDRVLRMPEIIFSLAEERRDWLELRRETRKKNKKEWSDEYDGYICIADRGEIKSDATLNAALKRICADAGIPIVTTHNLRHIAATMMFEYGTRNQDHPEEILLHVSEYLGHANIGTTFDVYTAYMEAESRIRSELEHHIDPILYAKKERGVLV